MTLETCFGNLKTQPLSCMQILSSLGFLLLLKHSISLLNWIFISFLRPPKNLKTTYGSWAIITGSTDGIGKAFGFQLARKGLNLILVSRNSHKLSQVSVEIQAQYPDTQIKKFVLDFSGDVVAGVRQLEGAIRGLEVGVLINNVGVTYPAAMYFDEVDEKVWMKVVNVNLKGTTLVTRAVVKGMVKRKRGAIVNIGSGASIVVPSHPLYAIYAATKAVMQVPLYVSTKMASKVACTEKSSLWIPSAEDYAAAAAGRIGYEARCTPYWPHAIQWFFASLFPETLLDAWRLSIGIRRRKF